MGDDSYLGDFGGKESLGFSYPVLHIYCSHIGVGTLLKINFYAGFSGIGRCGTHIHHVLHTVDLLFQRSDNTVQNSLCIGPGIGCGDPDGWRGDIRILRYR